LEYKIPVGFLKNFFKKNLKKFEYFLFLGTFIIMKADRRWKK